MKLLDVIRNPKYSKRLREVIGTFRQYNLDEWFGDIVLVHRKHDTIGCKITHLTKVSAMAGFPGGSAPKPPRFFACGQSGRGLAGTLQSCIVLLPARRIGLC